VGADRRVRLQESAEDLTALSEEEFKEILGGLVEEERAVNHRRRLLQGRIDPIRADFVRRGFVTRSPEELARVLVGDEGRP
jgi:hypothetical protein